MQPIIFNSLLVALSLSIEAAALPPAPAPPPGIEGLLPVVLPHRPGVKIIPKKPPHPRSTYSLQPLHARSEQTIPDAVPTGWVGKRSLVTTSLYPRSESRQNPTSSSSSPSNSGKPKARRMVYGWGPKSFESDHDGGSPFDMNLLSANPAETAEHPPKEKQKVPATKKTEAAPTKQPPSDVLKTLCAYYLDGHSIKNDTTGTIYPPTRAAPPNQGSDKDPWQTGPGSSDKNKKGVTESTPHITGSAEKSSMLTGAGDKSVLAISWCYRLWSYDSPRLNSTDTDKKPSATKSGATSSSPRHDSKNGTEIPSDASLNGADPPVKHSSKHTDSFKVPSLFNVPY